VTLAALVAVVFAGCASAGSGVTEIDAMEEIDAPPTIDAPPMIDAPTTCTTPMMVNLLTNPAFDLTPVGMGWTETQLDNETIIRGDSLITEDTAPNLAWLGGVPITNGTDALDQMVMVPASTTAIAMSGRYQTRSSETTANLDTAKIGVQPMVGNTYIGPTHDMSNSTNAAVWTDFNVVLPAAMLAGQTVRMHLTSTSGNATLPTSFYVDTIALTATYCPP
jgi:hypothetical protein